MKTEWIEFQATAPLPLRAADCEYKFSKLTPYPGWRFVPDGKGGLIHEKMPPWWRRIMFPVKQVSHDQ